MKDKTLEIITAWGNSFNPTKEQKDIADKRKDVCNECPSLKKVTGIEFCDECGCPISKKIYSDKNSCPLNKWNK